MVIINIPFFKARYVFSSRPRCCESMPAASAGVIEKKGASNALISFFSK